MTDLRIKLSLETENLNIGILEIESKSTDESKIGSAAGLVQKINELTMSTKILLCIVSIATAVSIYLIKH